MAGGVGVGGVSAKLIGKKKKRPPPREYTGKKIAPPHDTVGKFLPLPPPHVL